MDPGRRNFAWGYRQGAHYEVGMIDPIVSVDDDTAFCNQVIELMMKFQPDFMGIERFMVRGGGQSMLAESINQMIGRVIILTRMFAGIDPIQMTSASWKNWWNQNHPGKDPWHKAFAEVEVIHQRDALGMGIYIEDHWIEKNIK